MIITFLGTGTILAKTSRGKTHSYSSILVEIGTDKLLFDIGPGTLAKLQQIQVNSQKFPNYLFISHYHIDHCLDYPALIKSRYFDENTGHVKIGKSLNVVGPPGLKKWNYEIFSKIKVWDYMSNELNYKKVTNLKEVKSGVIVQKKNWKVSCIPVNHAGGIAFRVDSAKKSFVYSGDMTYDERISILGKKSDLVVVECSFPNKRVLKGKHLEPSMIAKLAKLGQFKKVALTHMYPQCYGKEKEISNMIKKNSDAKVIIPYDFQKIEL